MCEHVCFSSEFPALDQRKVTEVVIMIDRNIRRKKQKRRSETWEQSRRTSGHRAPHNLWTSDQHLKMNCTISWDRPAAVSPSLSMCVRAPATAPASTSHGSNHSAAPLLCQGLSTTTHWQGAGGRRSCAEIPRGGAGEGEVCDTTRNEICREHFNSGWLFTAANEATSEACGLIW